jgi:hypothetical protein
MATSPKIRVITILLTGLKLFLDTVIVDFIRVIERTQYLIKGKIYILEVQK